MKRRFYILLVILLFASTAYGRDVVLGWDPVTTDSRVAGYQLHYGTAAGDYQWSQDVDGASAAQATVQNLDDGTDYFFAVRSRNGDGSMVSAFSNEVALSALLELTPPGNLRIVRVITTTKVVMVFHQ